MHEVIGTKNGKFHCPAEPNAIRPWQPTRTKCGVTVKPLNYFVTADDADRYTGRRLSRFMCQRCAKAIEL